MSVTPVMIIWDAGELAALIQEGEEVPAPVIRQVLGANLRDLSRIPS